MTAVPTHLSIFQTAASNPTVEPSETAAPVNTTPATNTPSPFPTPTPTFEICSPLEDISLAELSTILTNPFEMPYPGKDDGHHGVDFAYYSHGTHGSIEGLSVESVLQGTVSTIVNNQPPYGNMIIIETPLKGLPETLIAQLTPVLHPTQVPYDGRLTCPSVPSPTWDNENMSVYLLYAHLKEAPSLHPGDQITCGQTIGQVGNTGSSGNPHLHFETRLGPAGVKFGSMAHYTTLASDTERSNYCLWRISGIFELRDPMSLLKFTIQATPSGS